MQIMQMTWLCIHVFGVLVGFFLLASILRQRDSGYKSRLIMTIICCLIALVSRSLFIMAQDMREMIALCKTEYCGKCFANFVALTFVLSYYRIQWNRKLMISLFIINLAMFMVIMTCDYHSLYYTSYEVAATSNGNILILGKAPIYYFYMIFCLVEMIMYLYVCINPKYQQISKGTRTIQGLLIMAGIMPFLLLLVYLSGITGGFDTTPLGILFSVVFLFAAVNKYGLFDTVQNAKETVIESMDEGIIVSDNNMKFLYANPSACKLFPDMRLGEGSVSESEIQAIYEQSGTVIDLKDKSYEIRTSEIRDEVKVRGYMLSVIDVTDMMAQAKLMKELKEKAENASHVKSAFLANMSHEIRTPMNAILGMTEIALRGKLENQQRDAIEQIKTASLTLITIINDILDFSKMESGKLEIVEADYDVMTLIKDVYHIISGKVDEKSLKLEITVDPTLPKRLYGDEIRMKQVLINLVNNAVKFTEQGSIHLNVEYLRREEDILLMASVKDTGAGIKPEDLDRIFNSFEQSDTFRNRKKEGSGLGLAISRQLLHLMGGDIHVESVYHEGSNFCFEVPQRIVDESPCGALELNESHARVEKTAEYNDFRAPNAHVLIVDDNLVNRKVAVGLMRPFAMQVETAKSGEEAIQMVREKEYHLIFMDHMMPDMDGVETTHIIRQMEGEYYKNVPIIALTANAISGVKEMFLQEGMNDFIAKPINVKELSEKILDWLPFELLENA
ncbi:MAG: response regulator [Lachnospiraceae bacterium]|nr:response regulator [Lachnospiraceae bacterium]